MAGFSERLAFILDLDPSNAVAGMKRVGDAADRELGKADDKLNRLGGRMQAFGAGAVVAAGVVGRALFGFAEAYEEAEAESRKLNQAMETNASFAAEGRESFDELAASLQDLTGVDGDAVTGMLGFLGTLGRTADEAQRAAPLIVDLATRFGLELEPAARLVNNAMEGNASRLERLIGPLREGESATDALARTVGGFAEGEAQTLQGQLEILKANLGDVAEGIGGGVVGAVNKMIGPLKSGAEWFTRLDEGTQNTIGSFAAYGTAALGVVGATSFVIGSVLKMVDNFKAAAEAVKNFRGGLVQLGTMGAIVGGLTAAAVGLDRLEDSLISARISMEDLSRASDAELVRSIDMGVAALANFGQTADDFYAHLAENGIGTLERYREALAAAGRSTEDIDAAIQAERVAQENLNTTTEAGTAALDGIEGATGEATDATAENTAAIEANQRAIEERSRALESARGNELSLAEAMIETANELDAYNSVMADGEATDRERTQAAIDLEQQFYAEAEAAGKSAADQAIASGNAAGAQQASTQAQIEALQRLLANLDENSPLREGINGHIMALRNIPTSITTQVLVNTNYGQGTTPLQSSGGGRIPVMDSGGVIPGPRGAAVPMIGHAGEVVLNEAQQANVAAGLSGGFVFAPQITLNGSATHADGELLIEAMRTYVQRSGSSELRQLLGVS